MLKKHFFYNEEAIVVAILWAWKVAYIWLKSQASAAEPPQQLVSGTCRRHELEDRIPTHGIWSHFFAVHLVKKHRCRQMIPAVRTPSGIVMVFLSLLWSIGCSFSHLIVPALPSFFYLCLTQIPLMHQMLTVTVGEGRRATMWGGPDVGWQTSKTTDILCFFYLHNFS